MKPGFEDLKPGFTTCEPGFLANAIPESLVQSGHQVMFENQVFQRETLFLKFAQKSKPSSKKKRTGFLKKQSTQLKEQQGPLQWKLR